MSDSLNKILWTATDFSIPPDIWKKLEGQGYKVLMPGIEENIIDKIQLLCPKLLVDQFDGESGAELARLRVVKERFPDLPVVLMSNQPSVEEAVNSIKLGALEYLTGNITSERLWAVIEAALSCSCPKAAGVLTRKRRDITSIKKPIAVHKSMVRVMELARKIAPSRSTVLVKGETGTGKEVLARFVHGCSDRRDGPFIAVNCAALPETLLESELFGHEKGSFTGAISRKKGKFELANGGTLLLDEISETEVSIQAKLLRVLQEREIDRVGGQFSIPVDVRVIATTNRDLEAETRNGNFRLDLFYRLNVVPVNLPPLRDRWDDIAPLGEFFLQKHCALNNIPVKMFAQDAVEFLKGRNWPGNVRELENLIERSTLLVDSKDIKAADLERIVSSEEREQDHHGYDCGRLISLKEMEKKMIFQALDSHRGNRTHAAKVLGISVRTLRNKLHEYREMLEKEPLVAHK